MYGPDAGALAFTTQQRQRPGLGPASGDPLAVDTPAYGPGAGTLDPSVRRRQRPGLGPTSGDPPAVDTPEYGPDAGTLDPSLARTTHSQVESNWLATLSEAELVQAQSEDGDLALVRTWVLAGQRPPFRDLAQASGQVKNYWAQFPVLCMQGGKLCRHSKLPNGEQVTQLVVPATLRRRIFHHLHSLAIGGHSGVGRTLAKLRRRFYWPGYKEDVVRWTQWCSECQRYKVSGRQGRAPLQQLPVGMPMERLAVDILGPLPPSDRGNRYILVL